MNELLLPGLLVGVIAPIAVAAIGMRVASLEQRLRALSRLEGKLDVLLKHQGIGWARSVSGSCEGEVSECRAWRAEAHVRFR